MTIKGIAPTIRNLLSNRQAMTVEEIERALLGAFSKGQVKASCFEMAKRHLVTKVGTGGLQRFKLAPPKQKVTRVYTVIETVADIAATQAGRGVETVSEWQMRTGSRIERLPNGASATPFKRIAA